MKFSQVIKSVSAESLIDFFGYYPKITIKVLDEWTGKFNVDFSSNKQSDEPGVVFSFCKLFYDKVITLVADMNKLSFEEAKKKSCLDPHKLYYFSSSFKKRWCNYCLLNGCFAQIVRFVFTSVDDQCLLEKQMIPELMLFAVSVFVLKKYYRKKTRVVNFNNSVATLSKAFEIVRQKK